MLAALTAVPTASAASSDSERQSTILLEDQEIDGTGVLLEHVEMNDGGYVSVHDARRRLYHEDIAENGLGSAAAISDSFIGLTDYLEPGEHRDVEIPLFDHSPWDLPGDAPHDSDSNRLAESQPMLAIPHFPTDPPEFQLGEDGAYREGSQTLRNLPVVHDLATVYVEEASDAEREAAKAEERKARGDFDGHPDEGVHWQVDFGGGDVRDPPVYWPDDVMAGLGHSGTGVTHNPDHRRQGGDGDAALEHVKIDGDAFEFVDNYSKARIEFTVESDATPTGNDDTVKLHLSSWIVPGGFDLDRIDEQERHDFEVDEFAIGESHAIEVDLPE